MMDEMYEKGMRLSEVNPGTQHTNTYLSIIIWLSGMADSVYYMFEMVTR